MIYRFILFAFLFPLFACAQNFSLNGRISGLSGERISIHGFYGAEGKRIDSVEIKTDGSFTYQFPKNAYTGMYRLRWGKNQMMDIIYNRENIRFTTHTSSVVDSLVFSESVENQLYFEYLQKRNEAEFKLELIYPLINMYPKDDPFYETVTRQYDMVNNGMSEWVATVTKKNTGKYAAKLIKADFTPRPSSALTEEQHVDFLKVHFFDQIDFTDTTLLYSNIVSSKTIQYLSLYQNNRLDKDQLQVEFIKAVNMIMEKTKSSPTVYAYVMDYLINGFNSYGFDKVITYIADNINLEDQCIDEERKAELEKKVESHKKFSAGKQLPDFDTQDIGGKKVKLSAINSDYTLLVFWATWCPHCNTLVKELKKIYLPDNRNKLEIIAVSLDDSKEDLDRFLKEGGYDWINVCDYKKWKGELVQQFDIFATPTMFLVSKDMTIQAKPITYNELMNELYKRNILK